MAAISSREDLGKEFNRLGVVVDRRSLDRYWQEYQADPQNFWSSVQGLVNPNLIDPRFPDEQRVLFKILQEQLKPLTSQFEQAEQARDLQYQQIQQKYNSPEGLQQLENVYQSRINAAKNSYLQDAIQLAKRTSPEEFDPANPTAIPSWVMQEAENNFANSGDQESIYQSFWGSVANAEQQELDALGVQWNRLSRNLMNQIDSQEKAIAPQIRSQIDKMYQRADSENIPFTEQDILGAFNLAPKTTLTNFLTGNITAQQLQAAQAPAQPVTQQAQPVTQPEALLSQAQPTTQPVTQQAQPVAQTVTQPVAQPATPAESPFLTGTAPVAPAATTAMTAPVTTAAPVTTTTAAPVTAAPVTAATAAPMATTLGTPMATPTSMDIAAQPISAGIGGQQAMPQTFLTGTATQPTGLTPESLPELRGGGASGQSAVDPALRPYLELGLRGAEQLFLQQAPSLYPGQMYVSPSQQTLDALAQTERIARAQPSALQAAQESYMAGLGGLGFTAGGGFLGSNPFQQRAIEAATRPIMQQFEQTTLPTIAGQFSAAGRYGSGAMGRITGQAQEASSRALGDVAANIAYTDYSRERGLQDAAIRNQLQASTLAPQIYGQQFLPAQQLAQVGAAREAIAAQPLQEAISRYQYQQQLPYQQLGGFLSSIYGTPLAGSQYQTPAQAKTNTAANALGLAALGGGIGSMIAGQSGAGGFTRPELIGGGAVLGGLAGLLG